MAAYFLKVKGRPGHQGIEREEAWGQGPNLDDSPKVVGSHIYIYIYIYIYICRHVIF